MPTFFKYSYKDQMACTALRKQPSVLRVGGVQLYRLYDRRVVRYSHILLAFFLLVNSSGLSVFKSYCCEKLKSVALYAPSSASCDDTCAANCDSPDIADDIIKKGCCRYSFDFYKWAGDLKVENNIPLLIAIAGAEAVVSPHLKWASLLQLKSLFLPDFATPYKDITVWHQVFRL